MTTVGSSSSPRHTPRAMMPSEMKKRLSVSRSARRFIVCSSPRFVLCLGYYIIGLHVAQTGTVGSRGTRVVRIRTAVCVESSGSEGPPDTV